MPKRKGEGTAAPPKPSTSARTRRKVSKPQLDKTVENEVQQSQSTRTPVTRVKKPQVGFPDRLDWRMAHLGMPTTSTPKVDLTTKKVTARDVDTAFGFDDSCNNDVPANYSTLISPIAHCSTESGGGVSLWKINPLTQRNVEMELPTPISRPEQENVSERRSTRLAIQKTQKVKSSRAKKSEAVQTVATTRSRSSTPKPQHPIEVAEVVKAATSAIPKPSSSKKIHHVKQPSTRSKMESTGKRRKKPLLPDEDLDDANKTSPFSALLEKYTDDKSASVDTEGELHVDPKKIIRTYGSRKRVKISEDRETVHNFIPISNVEINPEPKKKERSKRKPSSKTKSKKLDVLDEETEKWLEEKNKEFEDVLKVPLVIELSGSSDE